MDYGNYRKLIEKEFNDNAQIKNLLKNNYPWQFAFIRLEGRILKFESVSDDPNFLYLTGQDFKKQITHIIIG